MARKKFLRLVFLGIVQFLLIQGIRAQAEEEGVSGEENIEEGEKGESEEDDKLITKLLDTPIGDRDDSEVAKILKVLEAAELASTTTTTPATTTVSTTTTTTTPKPSPFFNTESPLKFSSRQGNIETSMNELIPFLDDQLKEVSKWVGVGEDKDKKADRRSDPHDPPLEGLLWGTARAVWEVSRPVFWKTKTGRKISLLKDTIKLPFRTIGAVKSHIADLKYHSHHHHHHGHDKRRSVLHHHPLDHGWGWEDPRVVYVKYEPENSLFKSWIRFLYKIVKPVALTKIKLKKALIKIKLHFLWKLVHLIKSAKLQKVFAALRAITTKLQILKARKHPSVVVLKETGVTKAPPVYGWGWGWEPPILKGWEPHPPPPPPILKGWSEPGWDDGWKEGLPAGFHHDHHDHHDHHHDIHDHHDHHHHHHHHHPKPAHAPPKPVYGPPKPAYGAPKPAHQSWSTSNLDITYGPPAKSSRGYANYNPSNTYGAPAKKGGSPVRIAYNQDNTYQNYQPPPAQYLMAPELSAQASQVRPQVKEIESPSYAKYLQQFGINPSNLKDASPPPTDSDSTRFLRQSDTDPNKELEVPYLSANATEEIKKRM